MHILTTDKGVTVNPRTVFNSMCIVLFIGLSSACLMEEEIETESSPINWEVLDTSKDSDGVKYTGTLTVTRASATTIEVDTGERGGAEWGSDSEDVRIETKPKREYKCDSLNNYVRFVEFEREDLPLGNGFATAHCAKRCDDRGHSCTGFFYFRTPSEHYCAYLNTKRDEGLQVKMKAYDDSKICFAKKVGGSIPVTVSLVPTMNRNYECGPSDETPVLNYSREMLPPGLASSPEYCQKRCDKNVSACKGYFLHKSSTEHFCGYFLPKINDEWSMSAGPYPENTSVCFETR